MERPRGADCSPDKKPCADWWVAFLSVAYLAGRRSEEILKLKWSDLRFTAKPEIRVWNQMENMFSCLTMRFVVTPVAEAGFEPARRLPSRGF